MASRSDVTRGDLIVLLFPSRVSTWLTFDPNDPERFAEALGSLTEATFSFHLCLRAATTAAEAEKVPRRPCWGVSPGSLSRLLY